MRQVILYSGQDCCLCEQAELLLSQINSANIAIEKVDVKSSTQLYHQYGARIPVLLRKDTQKELPWPFAINQLEEFLS